MDDLLTKLGLNSRVNYSVLKRYFEMMLRGVNFHSIRFIACPFFPLHREMQFRLFKQNEQTAGNDDGEIEPK